MPTKSERKEGIEMETETSMTQPSDKTDKEQWAKVQIYTPTHICTGYVYCPRQRRLLDLLNGIPFNSDEFLTVSFPLICTPDGTEVAVQSAHINKANILFLKEIGDEHSGLGSQVGPQPYPYVAKSTNKAVKLYMPLYTLTGQIQCTERRRVVDVLLNSDLRFFALTNVDICPLAGKSESGINFLAVNKGQILSLAELA